MPGTLDGQAESRLPPRTATLDLVEWKINLCVKKLKFRSLLLALLTLIPQLADCYSGLRVRKRDGLGS